MHPNFVAVHKLACLFIPQHLPNYLLAGFQSQLPSILAVTVA